MCLGRVRISMKTLLCWWWCFVYLTFLHSPNHCQPNAAFGNIQCFCAPSAGLVQRRRTALFGLRQLDLLESLSM